ncbi:nuclear transport factor 2 family protein [Pseudonocardia ailaonensis]|uniref:Nuclear transport factor 2 family protein n=1 Tax=Pseudonocardia ailaonensis TaxID=367279 RepID=A0ABN2MZ60_9PSEU
MNELQFFSDKHQIEQVYIRYCELVDAKDFDKLDQVFAADKYGYYWGASRTHSEHTRDSLIAGMHASLGPDSLCGATAHNVSNFRVRIDGDRAFTKVNFFAVHRGRGQFDGELCSQWGTYEDELVRTPQGWRVCKRNYTNILNEGPIVTVPA